MIDRLVHHGHLILFEGNSYRMEHALMKQTARQPGAGAESKDSTLNAKRSGSLWHKRTRITLLGRKQWMLLSFLLDKWKKTKTLYMFLSDNGDFPIWKWGIFLPILRIFYWQNTPDVRLSRIRLFIWLIVCLISGLVPGGWHFFTQFSTVGWHPELYDKLRWAVTRYPLVLLLILLCVKCILLFTEIL